MFKANLSRTTAVYRNLFIVAERDVRLPILLHQNDRHILLFPMTYHSAHDSKLTPKTVPTAHRLSTGIYSYLPNAISVSEAVFNGEKLTMRAFQSCRLGKLSYIIYIKIS